VIEDKVRKRASEILSELMQLDTLATSQSQRRKFKDARQYLERSIKTGSDTAYNLALTTSLLSQHTSARFKRENAKVLKEQDAE